MGEQIAHRKMYSGLTREQVATMDAIDRATTLYPGPNEMSTQASNRDLASILNWFGQTRVLTPSAIARRVRNLADRGLVTCYYEQKIDGRFDKRTIQFTASGLDRLGELYKIGALVPDEVEAAL